MRKKRSIIDMGIKDEHFLILQLDLTSVGMSKMPTDKEFGEISKDWKLRFKDVKDYYCGYSEMYALLKNRKKYIQTISKTLKCICNKKQIS